MTEDSQRTRRVLTEDAHRTQRGLTEVLQMAQDTVRGVGVRRIYTKITPNTPNECVHPFFAQTHTHTTSCVSQRGRKQEKHNFPPPGPAGLAHSQTCHAQNQNKTNSSPGSGSTPGLRLTSDFDVSVPTNSQRKDDVLDI